MSAAEISESLQTAEQARQRRRPLRVVSGRYLRLRQSEDGEGYSTLDVVNGLHGVAVALDCAIVSAVADMEVDGLAMAAEVLSSILRDRVEL